MNCVPKSLVICIHYSGRTKKARASRLELGSTDLKQSDV
jgi:hypothetical protein